MIPRWLCSPYEQGLQLPTTPIAGLALAIFGHAMWNGSSWALMVLTDSLHVAVQVFLILGWIVVLIASLWLISRRILASVLLDSRI
jgi:hypothetical protein